MRREIAAGLRAVFRSPLLRTSAYAVLVDGLTGGVFGALVVLYMSRGLGFNPGILGMIWAVGGVSSLAAASLTPRVTRRLGLGRTMVFGLALFAVSEFFIPLASGATLLSALFLILQQMGDGFYVAYEINSLSLHQVITPERMLGRVNATFRILALGSALLGALLGGLLGGPLGLRPLLFAASGIKLVLALLLMATPLFTLRDHGEAARAR